VTVDIRRPCDSNPDCEHRLCHVCEKRIRSNGQRKREHEGAVEGWVRDRLCLRCKIEGKPSINDLPKPEPEPEVEVAACGKSDDCYHRLCRDCKEPMRPNSTREVHHPGTVRHIRGGTCSRCSWDVVNLLPQDLKDQRHQLLSDEELAHVYEVDSHMYDWHLARRYRLRLMG